MSTKAWAVKGPDGQLKSGSMSSMRIVTDAMASLEETVVPVSITEIVEGDPEVDFPEYGEMLLAFVKLGCGVKQDPVDWAMRLKAKVKALEAEIQHLAEDEAQVPSKSMDKRLHVQWKDKAEKLDAELAVAKRTLFSLSQVSVRHTMKHGAPSDPWWDTTWDQEFNDRLTLLLGTHTERGSFTP